MKTLQKSAVFILGCFAFVSSHASPVRWDPATGGNGHLYEAVLVLQGISWTAADAAAKAKGAGWHLASVTSAAENDFIFGLIANNSAFFNPNYFQTGPWLGGYHVGPGRADYGWVTGEPFLFSAWAPREPFGNGQRIAFFGYRPQDGPPSSWNDIPTEQPLINGYIVELDSPPDIQILAQPLSREALAGTAVTMSVTATSLASVFYQWQFNAAHIAGATNASLTLTNVQLAEAGAYRCIISNSGISRTSDEAILKVLQYAKSARQLYELGFRTNGIYTIDLDGPGGQNPLKVECLMSLSRGGWTQLTTPVANSVLNTDASQYREYLYVRNGTALWYRTPLSRLVWSWSSGKDLYGTYYYSVGGGESSFNVTPSGEHQLYGVGGSSGPSSTYKCLIYYTSCKDPAKAQVQICQDRPGIFGGSCQCPVTVYIRELAVTKQWTLALTSSPTSSGNVAGAGSYPEGTRVQISATPAPGYRFAYWVGDGIQDTNASATTVLMTQARTLNAAFVKVWKLTVTADPVGGGTVTRDSAYDSGSDATISAVPNAGGRFLGWTGPGITDPGVAVTTVRMDQDRQVTAHFSAPDLAISRLIVPSNVIAGQLIQASWSITNQGAAAAIGMWTDCIRLSPDNQIGGDLPAAGIPVTASVLVEGAITRIQNIRIPANLSGNYWLVAEVNCDQAMPEVNYTDNVAISDHPIAISVPPYPNLQVSLVIAAPNVFAGQETVIQWGVTNTGPRSTESAQWQDAVYFSLDAQFDASDMFLCTAPNPSFLNSAQAYLNSCTVRIPKRIQGPYYIIVRTDYQNRVNEGGLDDDNTGVSPTVQVTLPSWPDLQIASVIGPLEAFSGQPAMVTWAVTNAGGGLTDESFWQDRIYLSTNTTLTAEAVPLGVSPHTGALAAGQSYNATQQVVLPIGISGTNYHFIVETDYRNEAWEYVFENNNSRATTQSTVIHLTPPPDLEVENVTVLGTAHAGFDFSFTYRVANNGASETPNYSWQDAIYLSTDQVWDPQADTFLGAVGHSGQLLRDQSYESSPRLRIPTSVSGPRYVIVVTDTQGTVFELDKTNNRAASSVPLNIFSLADFQVASLVVPMSALAGFDMNVNYRVTNSGPSATLSSAWTDSFYLSSGQNLNPSTDILLSNVNHLGQLDVSGSYETNVSLRVPIGLTGAYYVFVVTDSKGAVPEQNEANNSAISSATVTLELPSNDLEVVGIGAPTNALSGFNLMLTCVVTNNGMDSIPNTSWRDAFYLSADETLSTNDLFLAEATNSRALPAGGSYTNIVSLRLPDGLVGDFHVFVVADSEAEVFEQNETNNVALSALPTTIISIPPDLVVESCHGTANAIAGSTIALDWMVRNVGPGQTSVDSWSDTFVLSGDELLGNADDVSLGQFQHSGALKTGERYSRSGVSVALPASTAAGQYRLFVQADATRQVYEGSGDTNNVCLAGQIAIIRPDVDLVVSEVIAPTEGYSGHGLSVAWSVHNTGNSLAGVSGWDDYVYFSRSPEVTVNAIVLGTLHRSSFLAAGSSYRVTNSFALPPDVEGGDFFVIVRADGANQVVEALEENNDSATGKPSYIYLSPTPDLVVTDVTVPAETSSGQPAPISWIILNNGAATSEKWYDAIYLSLDQILDRDLDIYLGYVEHPNGIDELASKAATHSFDIPANLYGTFYVFVVADSKDRIYERAGEGNNTGYSPAMTVNLPPLSDLIVTAVKLPVSANVGQTVSISYTVLNQSGNAVNGRWEDNLYLSSDEKWDATDLFIGQVVQNSSLGPWQSYAANFTGKLPGALRDDYHIVVRSDVLNRIPENDEGNNTGASAQRLALDLPRLGTAALTNTLRGGQSSYYFVDAPAGATLVVTVRGTSMSRSIYPELFASFGQVPTRSQFEFGSFEPFNDTQRVVIPWTQAGRYYIHVFAEGQSTDDLAYDITAEFVEFAVFNSSFGRGGNVGNLTIEINGARFDRTLTAVLTNTAGISRSAVKMYYTDSTKAFATLELKGLTPGFYDLFVGNSSSNWTNIGNALEVVSGGGGHVRAQVDAPAVVGRNRWFSFTVGWGNDGINDVDVPLLGVRCSVPFGLAQSAAPLGIQYEFLAVSRDGPPNILRPAQANAVSFFAFSDGQPGSYDVLVHRLGTEEDQPFRWEEVVTEELGVPDVCVSSQTAVRLLDKLFPTWHDYLSILRRSASLLRLPVYAYTPSALIKHELLGICAEQRPAIFGRLFAVDPEISISDRPIIALNTLSSKNWQTFSFQDGSFIFSELVPGPYNLQVPGQYATTTVSNIVVQESAVRSVTLSLQSTTSLQGTVFDTRNLLVSAAQVILSDSQTQQIFITSTDNSGIFSF
ncbi:MAG: hypothetical protein L0Z50_10555 [Verrucomicrobiales bacterium]|nr:hypothetical protein [Verrucomicrobiales bacterium]